MATIFGHVDMGELASRLGTIDMFDRRGNIVWWDDFNDNAAKWALTGGGVGNAQALSEDTAYIKGKCLKLTAGSDGDLEAIATRYFPLPVTTRLGIEIIFAMNDKVNYFDLVIQLDNKTKLYYPWLRIDQTNDRIRRLTSPGNFSTVLDNPGLYESEQCFHALKLVWDYSTGKYIRLIVDQNTVDLSAYSVYSTGTSGTAISAVTIDVFSDNGANGILYLGGFILTQNEP